MAKKPHPDDLCECGHKRAAHDGGERKCAAFTPVEAGGQRVDKLSCTCDRFELGRAAGKG